MIVYTGGTFDMLHFGHINFFRRCKEIAGEQGQVVVSLNTDEFIEFYKGKAPVMNYQERERTILELRLVDKVIPNSEGKDSRPAIESVNPDVIAIGSDWARKDYYKQMNFTQDWLDDKNIILCYIPYTKGISSTEIKKRLRNRK